MATPKGYRRPAKTSPSYVRTRAFTGRSKGTDSVYSKEAPNLLKENVMFQCLNAIPLMQAAVGLIEGHKKQEKAFKDSLSKYPPEIAAKMIADRKELMERMQKEATEERRHQELCKAISNSGKWF